MARGRKERTVLRTWLVVLLASAGMSLSLGCSCPSGKVAPTYRENNTISEARENRGTGFADKSIVAENEYKIGIQASGY